MARGLTSNFTEVQMFDTKERIQEMHSALRTLVRSRGRGDVITNGDIAAVTGLTVDGDSWRYVIRQLQKWCLKELGIALWSLTPGEYKLLTDREQVRICALKRQQRMYRQSTRAKKELQAVSPEALSDHDRRLRLASLDNLAVQRRHINRGVRAVKSDVNPVRKVTV